MQDAKTFPYKEMWEHMVEFFENDYEIVNPDHQVHLDKIRRAKYVYILDQTSMELEMAKDCTLINIEEVLGSKYLYTIGMRNNSAYQQLIGAAYVPF